MAALVFFTCVGTFSAALKDSVYDVDTDPELAPMSGTVTFTPLIDSGNSVPAVTLTPASNLFLVPIKATIRSGVITSNGATGVKLVANTAVLGLTGSLYYQVDFGDGLTAGGKTYSVRTFTFQAPTTATTVDLVEVTPAVGQPATGPVPSSAVLSVAGRTGNVVITPADVVGMEDVAHKNAANGYAGLDGSGKIGTAQLPTSAMEYKGAWNASTNSPTLADGAGDTGDLYRVGTAGTRNLGSGSITFSLGDDVIYNGSTWEKISGGAVASVAGRTGVVVLTKTDVGLSNVDNTSDVNKPVSTAQAAADALKAPIASPTFTGTVAGITKAMVGLGSVDNTSDVNKPVSTAQGAAIKVLRASKNTVAAIGDSITAWGTSPNGYTAADNYLVHLCVESDQRMQLTGIFATPGYSLSQIQSTHLPSLLAMSPLPAACVVFGGTNDMTAGTVAAAQTLLKQIVASLTAVGVAPILVALPPRSDDTSAAQRTIAWNTWILRYAAQNGFGVIDTYTPLAGSDGVCLTQYQYDNVHPNWAGHRVIAQQAIRDGLPQMFPSNGTNRTSKSTADLSNMFNSGSVTYGLHTVDTNSDGLADGWTVSGAGTFGKSLITPAPMDGVQGKWQQMTRTTADNASAAYGLVQFTINSGWSVGDVLALSARVQTEGIESTATPWHLRLNCFQSAANNYRGPTSMQADYDGLIYNEITIPAGTTDLYLQAALQTVTNAGTAKLRFGEVTVRNLTTGGTLI